MVEASIVPHDEERRIAAVRRYDILDSPPDGAFERITALAARLFQVPIAIVSIVDSDRIWFKSHHGLAVEEIGRDPGLCASAILSDQPWLVTDAITDPRTLANPLVAGEFGLRFYAGVPLRTSDGYGLGTLCVIDKEPREVSAAEVASLEDLAAVVMDEMELRLSALRTLSLETEMRQRAEHIASTLQESLLPPSVPTIEGVDIATRYHVAKRDQVGGDFFDVVPTDNGVAIILGDACGKGALAAADAGTARWTLHTLLSEDPDPAHALERLNEILYRQKSGKTPERYVTTLAVALEHAAGGLSMRVAVGGHPAPVIRRVGGTVETVGTTGPIVGWQQGSVYPTTEVALASGDLVVMCSDGLLDALAGHRGADHAALRGLLGATSWQSADQIARAVDEAMPAVHDDDAAFLAALVA